MCFQWLGSDVPRQGGPLIIVPASNRTPLLASDDLAPCGLSRTSLPKVFGHIVDKMSDVDESPIWELSVDEKNIPRRSKAAGHHRKDNPDCERARVYLPKLNGLGHVGVSLGLSSQIRSIMFYTSQSILPNMLSYSTLILRPGSLS